MPGTSPHGGDPTSGRGCNANIGIHFFDLLLWLFGDVVSSEVHLRGRGKAAGLLTLDRARVRWFHSVDASDLPFVPEPGGRTTHRSIRVNGEEVEFADGFTDLHTRVYEQVLAGNGAGIDDARSSIELAYRMRTAPITTAGASMHPKLQGTALV